MRKKARSNDGAIHDILYKSKDIGFQRHEAFFSSIFSLNVHCGAVCTDVIISQGLLELRDFINSTMATMSA